MKVLALAAPGLLCAAELLPPKVTVGSRLQASASVAIAPAAPEAGLEITVTSSDPSRLLLSKTPDKAGSAKIVLTAKPGFRASPEFWVQALTGPGTVTYTASAPGFGSATGTVTLARSGIVMAGPLKASTFMATTGAAPVRISLYSVLLDESLKYVEQQEVAGGLPVEIEVQSSDPKVGTVTPSKVTIPGGSGTAAVAFRPGAAGSTTFAMTVPPGFSPPAELATITAAIRAPGLAVTEQVAIGENLQISGVLSLGEAAPASGLDVTLTSNHPKQLLLSANGKQAGSASITIHIPAGGSNATYYLQAIGGSGTATYTASAPGYLGRTGTVTLAPSGVLITAAPYGPPDEAELLRKEAAEAPRGFISHLSQRRGMRLAVWTAQLDPVTKRGADITVQELRPGVSVNVKLTSANPAVGTVPSALTIASGSAHMLTDFTPLTVGSTVISVDTPKGFSTPSNATSVTAIVRP